MSIQNLSLSTKYYNENILEVKYQIIIKTFARSLLLSFMPFPPPPLSKRPISHSPGRSAKHCFWSAAAALATVVGCCPSHGCPDTDP